MSDENRGTERVTFSRGYDVCIMAIDGTWRRDCVLNAISETDATLTVEGSIQGLNLKEFFLLLSSTGLAYRRRELVRVNGTEMDISFLKGKNGKKRGGASQRSSRSCPAHAPATVARSFTCVIGWPSIQNCISFVATSMCHSMHDHRRTGNVRFDCCMQLVFTGGVVSKFAMSCVPPLSIRPSR